MTAPLTGIAKSKSDHISNLRKGITNLIASVDALLALQREASLTVMGYVSGGANAIQDADFVGANAGLTAAQYNATMAALGATDASLDTVPSGGQSIYSVLYAMK